MPTRILKCDPKITRSKRGERGELELGSDRIVSFNPETVEFFRSLRAGDKLVVKPSRI